MATFFTVVVVSAALAIMGSAPPQTCKVCLGAGSRKCFVCDGTGVLVPERELGAAVEPDYQYDSGRRCRVCRGVGYILCKGCKGTGYSNTKRI